jgi:hypothetical protein
VKKDFKTAAIISQEVLQDVLDQEFYLLLDEVYYLKVENIVVGI